MRDSTIIDDLGGPTKVAELCEIKPQAVSQWKKTGIPKARRMYLQAIRPDVFELASDPAGEKAEAA